MYKLKRKRKLHNLEGRYKKCEKIIAFQIKILYNIISKVEEENGFL